MEIRKVNPGEKQCINEIVEIHLKTFTGFFLTFMGRGFLRQMYSCYTVHEDSGLLAAEENGKTIGFLAYSANMSGLYKYMIKYRLIPFGWYSLGAFLRKPAVFMRLIRAFLKPGEAAREEKYIEVSSLGVSPEIKSKGIGSRLLDSLKQEVDFSNIAYIALETDAEHNELANHFYCKNGFQLVRSYETHEGRKMNEYRFIN